MGIRALIAFDRRPFGGLLISRITLVGGDDIKSIDIVEPADPDFAARALDRALDSSLRDHPIRVLTPEDFVLFKLLSTRERDLDDASSVMRALASEVDRALIDGEVLTLSRSLPDVNVAERWRRLFTAS